MEHQYSGAEKEHKEKTLALPFNCFTSLDNEVTEEMTIKFLTWMVRYGRLERYFIMHWP